MVERFKRRRIEAGMKRRRMESDGLYFSDMVHWEMFEGNVYIQHKGKLRFSVILHIPIDIARHLNLKNKQRVTIAIKHNEGKGAV